MAHTLQEDTGGEGRRQEEGPSPPCNAERYARFIRDLKDFVLAEFEGRVGLDNAFVVAPASPSPAAALAETPSEVEESVKGKPNPLQTLDGISSVGEETATPSLGSAKVQLSC